MTVHGPDSTDPGETFDLNSADFVRDPFGCFARMRERPGLTRGVIPGVDPMWVATRYEDVRMVMTDARFLIDAASVRARDVAHRTEQTWQARGMFTGYEKYLRAALFDADGPDHRRLRGLVSRVFSARAVARLRPAIEAVAEDLLGRLRSRARDGVVDLIPHFARPLPITVICELIAVPPPDRDRWQHHSSVLTSGVCGPELGEALRGMVDDAHRLVELHRADPGEDLVSELITAQDADGGRLDTTEMVSLIVNLIVAGHVTTVNLIANGTLALLTHPDQLALVRDDTSRMPGTVEETMRWCGPVLRALPRYATEDVTVGGTVVRKGESVIPILGGANHDPHAYTEPRLFDIMRAQTGQDAGHLGFGHGVHRCLGAHLAQQEGEVAMAALLRQFPDLALAVAPQDLRRGTNPVNWHLKELPVRL
ncbi:cytochrome P450 [Streptomyces sp. B1866]|uniref:cytochrome P450 family protein n=1 Tax=Streptomyces sp. B1866 TaxID=3075431 RepID=UPI00289078EE|nr:cytochrome P450 [Streptomyces sp. B1866]MDT3395188.1 cytochrome P450 [Streptomyces sp. B1866]